MVFINNSQVIGQIMESGTNITGSLFMTVLIIFIVIIALAMLFRLPLEITIPVILPLFVVSMAYSTEFLAIGGLLLIYLAIIFTKRFFIN